MTESKSAAGSAWPKFVLWALVIAFGVFYLNAMRERGSETGPAAPVGQQALAEADKPSARETQQGALARAESAAQDGAAAQSKAGAADSPASPAGGVVRDARSVSTDSSSNVALTDRASEATPGSSTAAAAKGSSEPAVAPAAPSTSERRATGARVDADTKTAASAQRPGPSGIGERRARLMAEYQALVESVEAERRRIWDEMNRLSGGGHWPYPYPDPASAAGIAPSSGRLPPGPGARPARPTRP